VSTSLLLYNNAHEGKEKEVLCKHERDWIFAYSHPVLLDCMGKIEKLNLI